MRKLVMRHPEKPQLPLGHTPIRDIKIDLDSRDDIPKILLALQHVHEDKEWRKVMLGLIADDFAAGAALDKGARGMDLWAVLVLGVFRLGLDCDFDRLAELANEHASLRKMLGHGAFDEDQTYAARTLGENLSRLRPETLKLINWVIVNQAHTALGVDEETVLRGQCDSSVVQTDTHYPTDANLLVDAIRKILDLTGQAAQAIPDLTGWREYRANYAKFRSLYHRASKLKRSTAKDEAKREAREAELKGAYLTLLETAAGYVRQAEAALEKLDAHAPEVAAQVRRFILHARRQGDQIRARVIRGETIPHGDKVFSLFEEHTEWIVKGKAGVPVELGVRTAFLKDQHGLVLNHRVMFGETDDKITVHFTQETQIYFPNLRTVSFDKGFYTPDNRDRLDCILQQVTLPKKGKWSEADRKRESTAAFVAARKQHPAVESTIHALQVHGLERCRDKGRAGFQRYIAWGITAYNLHRLGAILLAQERQERERQLPQAA